MTTLAKLQAVRRVLFFSTLIMSGCSGKIDGVWTPPANPDPRAILNEAKADAAAGRYHDSLSKQVWFHENALKIDPSFYGVRLSFALGSWIELGKSYPPALEKLKSIRDDDEKAMHEGKKSRELFDDFGAINQYLGDENKSKDFFVWLDSNDPAFAAGVFDIAEPALIKAKEYRLCGKYLDSNVSFEKLVNLYDNTKQIAKESKNSDSGKRLNTYADKSFSNGSATLVALLVLNDRKDEAGKIASRAIAEWNDPQFKAQLETAKAGEVPPPWP